MNLSIRRMSLCRSGLVGLLGATAITFLMPGAAQAQHKARMSRSLEQRVAQGGGTPVRFLVQAPQAEVDRLARTYGVEVVKRLALGALLSGTGSQITRVAGDGNVGALAADDVVVATTS